MAEPWFILADDLTGAADARDCLRARVASDRVDLGRTLRRRRQRRERACLRLRQPAPGRGSGRRGVTATAAARCLQRGALPGCTRRSIRRCAGNRPPKSPRCCGGLPAPFDRAFGVFAPANPAMGRTTLDGRVLRARRAAAKPPRPGGASTLIRARTWPRSVEGAGLRAIKLPLAQVRAGGAAVRDALPRPRRQRPANDAAAARS